MLHIYKYRTRLCSLEIGKIILYIILKKDLQIARPLNKFLDQVLTRTHRYMDKQVSEKPEELDNYMTYNEENKKIQGGLP